MIAAVEEKINIKSPISSTTGELIVIFGNQIGLFDKVSECGVNGLYKMLIK